MTKRSLFAALFVTFGITALVSMVGEFGIIVNIILAGICLAICTVAGIKILKYE